MSGIDPFLERPDKPDSWRTKMARLFLDLTMAQDDLNAELESVKNELALVKEENEKLKADQSEMHLAVNHRRGYQTIQSFSRTHHLELSREEAQKHGVALFRLLKKTGRLGEINKTDELTVGAKNDKVNEYSVECLTEYFHNIGLI